MSDQLLTVSPAALHELLSDVARTAGTDFTLPMLNGILLQVEETDTGKVLVGTSTNRFVLGQASIPAKGEMETTFLALDRVKQLLAILKPYVKSGDMSCEVKREADKLSLSLPGDLVLPAVSVTVPISDQKVDFPKVSHFLPTAAEAKPGAQVALNPRFMSAFCAIAKGRNENLRLIPGAPDKPQLVLIGESYRALIMPVRSQESPDTAWFVPAGERERAAKKLASSAPKARGEAA